MSAAVWTRYDPFNFDLRFSLLEFLPIGSRQTILLQMQCLMMVLSHSKLLLRLKMSARLVLAVLKSFNLRLLRHLDLVGGLSHTVSIAKS